MAVHIIAMTDILQNSRDYICTSEVLAKSINTNPVVVRRIIAKLKSAGLIGVRAGAGGTFLLKSSTEINLLDVFNAVEVIEDNHLFNCHTDSNCECSIASNIHSVLSEILIDAQLSMQNVLKAISLSQVANSIKSKLICNK